MCTARNPNIGFDAVFAGAALGALVAVVAPGAGSFAADVLL
jgi:hypothetical protein